MRQSIRISLGIISFLLLSAATFVFSFQSAERTELSWTNEKLSELKKSRGTEYLELNDPQVKEILDKGAKKGRDELKGAMKASLILVAAYAVILALFISRARKTISGKAP